MKKYRIGMLAVLALIGIPFVASAHEHATFVIGGQPYNFVVGSLNEPITVDDRTGVDLFITKGGGEHTMGPDGDMDGPPAAATPVTGLEDTLQVELIAGNQKKTLSLKPVTGKPGAYQAPFYPTVATTYSYRFFGTIEGNKVDVTFSCVPEVKDHDSHDTQKKELPGGITQTMRGGGFTCPKPKADLGFPEQSAELHEVKKNADMAPIALGVSAVALLAAGFALRPRKNA